MVSPDVVDGPDRSRHPPLNIREVYEDLEGTLSRPTYQVHVNLLRSTVQWDSPVHTGRLAHFRDATIVATYGPIVGLIGNTSANRLEVDGGGCSVGVQGRGGADLLVGRGRACCPGTTPAVAEPSPIAVGRVRETRVVISPATDMDPVGAVD